MKAMRSDRDFLQALDQTLEVGAAPLGFRRVRAKRLERRRANGLAVDVIEIQRGKGTLLQSFAVNLRVEQESSTAPRRCLASHRLGSWPESKFSVLPVLFLSPLLHLAVPIFWVTLFTDRWWRIPKIGPFNCLTRRNVVNTLTSSAEKWFQGMSASEA